MWRRHAGNLRLHDQLGRERRLDVQLRHRHDVELHAGGQPTYLLLVSRTSATGDSISSISSTGLTPSLTTASFTSVTSQNYNTSGYQWVYSLTTASTGTGTITVNFVKTANNAQIDLLAITGANATTPIVTTNEELTNAASGTTATADLPSAPASGDAGVVFLSGNAKLGSSAPAGSPAMTNVFYTQGGSDTAGVYYAAPGNQNESFTISSHAWATIALEIAHP